MGRELELKYRANALQIAEIQAIYSGFTTISMETTYFDNPDKTFSELRWTLRRRMENDRSVCTLKTPLPDGSRGEWELECDDISAAIPKLCALGAPEELAAMAAPGLSPSCGARFTRLAKLITEDAFTVELALDQGVLLGGGKELTFAEVEVEYKDGSEAEAIAFANALAWKFGLTREFRSKIARAQDLAANT